MAGTITATLTLSGQGVTSDPIAIAPTTTLGINEPCVESGSLIAPLGGGGATTLTTSATLPMYLYIKNTGVGAAGGLVIDIGGTTVATVMQGAWMWIPVADALAVEYDTQAASVLDVPFEYAFWAAV